MKQIGYFGAEKCSKPLLKSLAKLPHMFRLHMWIRGVTGIFFWGDSHFSWFFSQREMLFPLENSHFGRLSTNFRRFPKAKKKVLTSFIIFPTSIYNLQFCLLFFYSIFTPFPFFSCLFFPIRQHKNFPVRSHWGVHSPPAPPPSLLRHWCTDVNIMLLLVF